MYRPTMSSSFSTKSGSRETLKPRTRCGFNPLVRHTRNTVVSLTPHLLGQRARPPVVRRHGQGLGRAPHDLGGVHLGLAATALKVACNGGQSTYHRALPPAPNLYPANLQFHC